MNNQNENTINANNANAIANATANSTNASNATARNTATNDKAIAEKIREQYVGKKQTKLDLLRKLDRKATKSAEIFAYTFGSVGTLVFGGGMCLAMEVIGNLMPLGIVIGCVGIAMITANFFIYKAIAKKSRKKYESDILTLTEEILGE